MGTEGTARRIGPIADEVLAWVARMKVRPILVNIDDVQQQAPTEDEIRRIELCALAAREAAMFHDLYGMDRMRPTGQIVHRDPDDDSGYYLPEADRQTLHANYTPPRPMLEDATCDDCGKPATWYMIDYSGPTIFGCEEHRHATAPEVRE